MNKVLISVEPDALDEIRSELAEIRALMVGATITPEPKWISIDAYAEKHGVTKAAVNARIRKGQLEARGSGKTREVNQDVAQGSPRPRRNKSSTS